MIFINQKNQAVYRDLQQPRASSIRTRHKQIGDSAVQGPEHLTTRCENGFQFILNQ